MHSFVFIKKNISNFLLGNSGLDETLVAGLNTVVFQYCIFFKKRTTSSFARDTRFAANLVSVHVDQILL